MVRPIIRSNRRIGRRCAAAGAAALSVLTFVACGSSSSSGGSGGSSSLSLTAADFSFNPNQLSVQPGASVTVNVTNSGKTKHSFTLDSGNGTVDIDPGSTNSLTFTAPQSGSLTFHCKYHPTQMTGTITVGGAGGNSSTSSGGGAGY